MWRLRKSASDDPADLPVRSGATASFVVHLVLVVTCVLYANARPYAPSGDQTIAVDIVTQQQADQQPQPSEPTPAAPPELSVQQAAPAPTATPPPVPPQPTKAAQKQPPQKQAQPSPPPPTPTPPPPQQQAAAQPAYRPPEPDITVKYQVDLGLMGLTPTAPTGKDNFDAQASAAAKVAQQDVAAFRAKLKSCATLPDTVAPGDKVVIKLRAMFAPDGRLARTPVLIEASASAKGPLLMQAAIAALEACQPYAMLPADKYDEWKILDLGFTPQDFRKG